jgi:hypothetical protein
MQMVKPASEPQGHGVFKRKAWPLCNALAAHGVAMHQRQLRLYYARSDRCTIAPTVFGLHLNAFGNAAVIHDARAKIVRLHSVCHIALSARGP